MTYRGLFWVREIGDLERDFYDKREVGARISKEQDGSIIRLIGTSANLNNSIISAFDTLLS